MSAPAVGAGWGCHLCGALGPILVTRCPTCQTELSPVVLAGRQVGVHLYNQGLAAAQAGFFSEATELLELGIDLAGEDPEALSLLGLLYYRSGRVVEATAAWQQAGVKSTGERLVQAVAQSENASADASALQVYNLALDLAGRSRWNDAVEALLPLRESPSRLAPAYVLLGLCHWALQSRDEAKTAWHHAIELDPSTPGLQVCLAALIAERVQDAERSIVTPEVVTSARPAPGRLSIWVPAIVAILVAATASGAAYRNRGVERARADGAVAQAKQQVIAAEETARAARAEADKSEAATQQAAQAAQAATDAVAQAAAREVTAIELLAAAAPSQRADGLEKLVEAIAQARRAGVVVPEWLEQSTDANRVAAAVARYFDGYRAFMTGEYGRAIAAFEASLTFTPAIYCSDDAAYLAARSAQLLGRHAEAVTWYARVIAEFPRSAYQDDARYFGAIAADQAGDEARAITWYKELLASFPGSGYDWDAKQALARLQP